MKKLFSLLAILTVFGFVGVLSVSAQLNQIKNKAKEATKPKPANQTSEKETTGTTAKNQDAYPKHFFFTTPAKATDKILKAKDLTACIFGDGANPSNKNAFKKVVPTVGGAKGRVIDAGTCDVVVLVIKTPEQEKNLEKDNAGFAVYKIVGDDLELLFKPQAGDYIAVGTMDLASSDVLKKADLRACGHSELRSAFRPNPNTWGNWLNELITADNIGTRTRESLALGRSCAIWVMTPELYKAFVKKFGDKYPTFNVSPENPELTRRK